MTWQRTVLALMLACLAAPAAAADGKIGFWDSQRKGANMMNEVQTEAQFAAAERLGLQFVRLAVDKWHAADRDFLIGNADRYRGLSQADLARLNQVLDWADRHRIKIVLTMLSLPGDRWKQLNGDRDDPRLWHDKAYWDQAAAFSLRSSLVEAPLSMPAGRPAGSGILLSPGHDGTDGFFVARWRRPC